MRLTLDGLDDPLGPPRGLGIQERTTEPDGGRTQAQSLCRDGTKKVSGSVESDGWSERAREPSVADRP